MSWLLILLLVLLLFGGLPGAPLIGGHGYGYGPSGVIGVLLIIVIILALTGRL